MEPNDDLEELANETYLAAMRVLVDDADQARAGGLDLVDAGGGWYHVHRHDQQLENDVLEEVDRINPERFASVQHLARHLFVLELGDDATFPLIRNGVSFDADPPR
jgi:hypothetical protein